MIANSGSTDVVIVNSLGGTLHHYTDALRQTLTDSNQTVIVTTVLEPSASQNSRLDWIRAYLTALRRAARRLHRGDGGTILVTWPVLGYIDFIILKIIVARGIKVGVIVHDPMPLVRAVGYSPIWRSIARSLFKNSGVIVHSLAAHAVLESQGLGTMAELIPHPVLPSDVRSSANRESMRVIRSLGQYKADRDLDLLRDVAPFLGDFKLEIWGRGWPDVPGWDVHNGYVDEQRLDELIATSSAVIIPYKRFYQSGIAIRALEIGTPFVGPRESSLQDLYGDGSPYLVGQNGRPDEWVRALRAASEAPRDSLDHERQDAVEKSREAWIDWIS